MKKVTTIILLLTIFLTVCSCSTTQKITDTKIYFPEKNINNIPISADMLIPTSMSELYKNAHSIVVCNITKADESVKKGEVDLAISSGEIVNVIKGTFSSGDTILIQETGERQKDYDISIDGAPLLRKDMKVLLFLNQPTTENYNGKTTYGILGCYYGKFFYDNNNMIHSAVDFTTEAATLLSDFKNPIEEQTVLDKINIISNDIK